MDWIVFMHAGLCSVSDNGVMVFPSTSKGHVQVVVSDGDLCVLPPDLVVTVSQQKPCYAVSKNGHLKFCGKV